MFDGEIVWEFFNLDVKNGKCCVVYCIMWMSEEWVDELVELVWE